MRFLLAVLISSVVFITSTGYTYADNLLSEISDVIQLVSMQTEREVFDNSRPVINKPMYPSGIKAIIHEAAERYKLSPILIESIIKVESNYNPRAVSNKGAMGLMQLMPATAREIGVKKPFDPYQNIIGGTYYYRLMLDRFGDHRKALWAYNCGPGCVENGYIPGETRDYAKNVVRVYKNLKQKKGGNNVK